jgi:hypothetical protein
VNSTPSQDAIQIFRSLHRMGGAQAEAHNISCQAGHGCIRLHTVQSDSGVILRAVERHLVGTPLARRQICRMKLLDGQISTGALFAVI